MPKPKELPKRKEKTLDNTLEYINTIKAIIEDIKSGTPEKHACAKHNMEQHKFRYFVMRHQEKYEDIRDDTLTKLIEKIEDNFPYTPCEKLYAEIFGIKLTQETLKQIPYDIEETIPKIIETMSETEQSVIIGKYWENKTTTEIAIKQDMTVNQIATAERTALRKLRKTKNSYIIRYGFEQGQKEAKIRKQNQKKYREQSKKKLNKEIAKNKILENEILKQQAVNAELQNRIENLNKNVRTIPTLKLPLSYRTKNALNRHMLKYVNDLDMMDMTSFLELKSIGKTMALEIMRLMEALDLTTEKGTINMNLITDDTYTKLCEYKENFKKCVHNK